MNQDQFLIQHIQKRFAESYRSGLLNRKWLSKQVFNDPKALNDLNSLVHPIVHQDYLKWVNQQSKDIVAYESAIVFEHGSEGKFDVVILVSCPEKIRLERIQQRDGLTQDEIQIHVFSGKTKRNANTLTMSLKISICLKLNTKSKLFCR